MDEEAVFAYLSKQTKAILLDYLREAFSEMNAKQRRMVFGDAAAKPEKKVNAAALWDEIDDFRQDSLAGNYYAPFMINSKNFMDVPEETDEWCELFANYVGKASQLAERGEHAQAVKCFGALYKLLEAVDSGEEIFFAEEAGSWMIPAKEKDWLKTYLKSLAATAAPEEFAAAAVPIIQRDSGHSFAAQAYASAIQVANKEQKALLRAELERRKVRMPPEKAAP